METKQTISVKNEYGKQVDLELIDTITIGSDKYVILSVPGAESANAYRAVSREKGEVEYASIGNGPEFQRVLEAYVSE